MKLSTNNSPLFVCADCLLTLPSIEGSVKPLPPHSHRQYGPEHPLGICHGEIREINLVDYHLRRQEADRVDAEISKLTSLLQAMISWKADDTKTLQSLNGKFRLPALAELFRNALKNLDSALEQSQFPIQAQIEILRLSPHYMPKYLEFNQSFVEKLLHSEAKWAAWQTSPLLATNPDTNYKLIPYPEESDFAREYVCAACSSSTHVEQKGTPRISQHSDLRDGSICSNSMLPLRRQDLCTISANCQSVKSTVRAELVPVKLDPKMIGQTLILGDGTVLSYGSAAHRVWLQNNERPETLY